MSLRDVNWGPLGVASTTPHPILAQDLISPDRRQRALDRLHTRDLHRAEDWRYTSLKSLKGLTPPLKAKDESTWSGTLNGLPIDGLQSNGVRLYRLSDLADQSYDDLTDKAWAWINAQLNQEEAMHDLQSLHFQDGLLVVVEADHKGGDLDLVHLVESTHLDVDINATNFWIYLGPNAALNVTERFVSQSDSTLNAPQHKVVIPLSSMYLSRGSQLTYTRSQDALRGGVTSESHLGRVTASVFAQAQLTLTCLNLGADLCRLELDVSLEESSANADLYGLYLGSDRAELDQHLILRHKANKCTSSQRFKGALGARSKGVFTGRIIVSPGASSTRADQNNPNLLLSESAKAVTRPQLEIYNDDVECSHGATVGQLDKDALFYLKARGLCEADALRALTSAFVGEIREALTSPDLKNAVDFALRRSLGLELDVSEQGEEWIDWEAL
jgi:Fe-S cluster assembly scaffold protein SufB